MKILKSIDLSEIKDGEIIENIKYEPCADSVEEFLQKLNDQ